MSYFVDRFDSLHLWCGPTHWHTSNPPTSCVLADYPFTSSKQATVRSQ